MRRLLIVLAALPAACGPAEQAVDQVWAEGPNGLCLAGEGPSLRAGLIVYGEGDSNCSLAGPAVREGATLRITPTGDSRCTVEISLKDGQAVLGPRSPACAYYCGPSADYSGRRLGQSQAPATSVTDFAGDPLC